MKSDQDRRWRAGVLLIAFVVIEARVEAPLLPLRVLRSRSRAGADSVGFLLGGSFYAFLFIETLYLQLVLGYSALQTGPAWLATSLTSVALAGLSQWLVIRVGPAPVLAAGMVLIAGATLWATQVGVHGRSWADLAGPLFVAGAGTAFAFIPTSIAGLAGVARRDAGCGAHRRLPVGVLGVRRHCRGGRADRRPRDSAPHR